ncbi:MAG TPA: ribonuclease III [Caldilineae bacterium]|nr:ribonuclease III [Caldilineae bacterium]
MAQISLSRRSGRKGYSLLRITETIERFEAHTGLRFNDKTLLQRALTHRSFLNESPDFPLADNERLEFLGDAVLDFLVAEFLYHRFPEQREGPLTNMRAALVRRDTLARFARQISLGQFLFMGRGEEETGGRNRPGTLCAAFEALIGALYLDQGLEAVKAFIYPFIEPELDHVLQEALNKDAKSRLQEWSQAHFQITPYYRTVSERGPDHAKEFTVQAVIDGVVYGEGEGRSKQLAAQAAAQAALENLARLQAEGKLPIIREEEETEEGDDSSP